MIKFVDTPTILKGGSDLKSAMKVYLDFLQKAWPAANTDAVAAELEDNTAAAPEAVTAATELEDNTAAAPEAAAAELEDNTAAAPEAICSEITAATTAELEDIETPANNAVPAAPVEELLTRIVKPDVIEAPKVAELRNESGLEGNSSFRDGILARHNSLRALHGAPPLEWSDQCTANAQLQADACAEQKSLFHGNHEGQGQNVRAGCSCMLLVTVVCAGVHVEAGQAWQCRSAGMVR